MKARTIKHGWQSQVFIYSDHVIKIRRPYKTAKASVIKWKHMTRSSGQKLRQRTLKIYTNLEKAKKQIQDAGVPMKIFGDMKIYANGKIYQKRAVVLETRLKNLRQKKDYVSMKNIVDQYISLNHMMWQHGIFEKIFNFPKNYGIIRKRVIILDPFEQHYRKEDIHRRLKERPWLNFLHDANLPKPVRNYYIQSCKKNFTRKIFDELWEKAIK